MEGDDLRQYQEMRAEIESMKRKWIRKIEVIQAIQANCTCGGAGPGEGCPACETYHWLFPEGWPEE